MKFLFRPVFLGLFVFWIFFPFLSIIIWSVAAGWRFPDILPKQYYARGYAVSLDPNGDIVQGAITSTVIALIDILKSEFNWNDKIVWILVVFFFNLIGVILYITIGRKQKL